MQTFRIPHPRQPLEADPTNEGASQSTAQGTALKNEHKTRPTIPLLLEPQSVITYVCCTRVESVSRNGKHRQRGGIEQAVEFDPCEGDAHRNECLC